MHIVLPFIYYQKEAPVIHHNISYENIKIFNDWVKYEKLNTIALSVVDQLAIV